MTCARWLLLCLLLPGCAGAPTTSGFGACALRQAAEVPLGFEQGHVTAPAAIEGKQVSMLVDTGAEMTIVTPAAVAALALQRDPHAHTTIHGVGGTIVTQNARLQSFGLGGMELLDQSEAVSPLPDQVNGRGYVASGLIGADWLRDFDVDLDLPNRRMTLYRAENCRDAAPPWPGPRTEVPAARFGRGIMLVRVALDGVPFTAILDSGANRSVLSEQAAARAGITAAVLSRDPVGRGGGVDGAVRTIHLHRFAALDVGTDHTRGQAVVVAPLRSPPGVDMLLGLDWLGAHRVWIDYRDRKLVIQPAAPNA